MQAATEAASGHNNNNNQGVYPPQQPVMYGPMGQGYDPAAAQLTQEGKPPPPPQQGGKYDGSPISWIFYLGGGGSGSGKNGVLIDRMGDC